MKQHLWENSSEAAGRNILLLQLLQGYLSLAPNILFPFVCPEAYLFQRLRP